MNSTPETTQEPKEIENGKRWYTAWTGDFVFPPRTLGGPDEVFSARVIWAGHYSDTMEHARERQERETANLLRAVSTCPQAIQNVKPDGVVGVDFTEGAGAIRNRAFRTPIGEAYAIAGDMLGSEQDGETPTTDVLVDDPSPDAEGLAAMLAAMLSIPGEEVVQNERAAELGSESDEGEGN